MASDFPKTSGGGPFAVSGSKFVLPSGTTLGMTRDIWEQNFAKGFHLAPQIYLLDAMPGSTTGKALPPPFDHLPIHLTFASHPQSDPEEQVWAFSKTGQWHWHLAVKSTDYQLIGTLTAKSPTSKGANQLVWRSEVAWDFFGSNRLLPINHPDSRGAVPLIATAP